MPRFISREFIRVYTEHCATISVHLAQIEEERTAFIRRHPLMLLGCHVPSIEEEPPVLFLDNFQIKSPDINIIETLQEPLALLFSSESFPYSIDKLIINMYNNLFKGEHDDRVSDLDSINTLAAEKVRGFYLWLLIAQPTLLNCFLANGKSLKEVATLVFVDTPEVMADINTYYRAQQQAQHGISKSLRCVNILTEQLSDGARSLPTLIARHFALGVNNVWLNPIDLSSTVTWSRTADYRTPVVAESVADSKYARSRDDVVDPLFVGHTRTKDTLDSVLMLEDGYNRNMHLLPMLAPCVNHHNMEISLFARSTAIKALEEYVAYCDQLSDAHNIAYNITRLYSRPQMLSHRVEMSQHVLQSLGLLSAYNLLREITDGILSISSLRAVTSEISKLQDPNDLKKYINLAFTKIKKFNGNPARSALIKGSGDTLHIEPDIAGFIEVIKQCPQTLRLLFGEDSYSNLCEFSAYLSRMLRYATDGTITTGDLNRRIKNSRILAPIFNITDFFNSNRKMIFNMAGVLSDISELEALKAKTSEHSKIFSIECQLAVHAAKLTEAWMFTAPKCQEKVGRLEMLQGMVADTREVKDRHSSAVILNKLREIFTIAQRDIDPIFHPELDKLITGLKGEISANAKLVFSMLESITDCIHNPKTWGSHTLLEGEYRCPTNLRSRFFTSEAIEIARREKVQAQALIETLSTDEFPVDIKAFPNAFVLIETNLSRAQRYSIVAKLIAFDDFSTPLLDKERVLAEHRMLSQLDDEYAMLRRLKSEDDQVVRCVTNIAKCMGIGMMFDLVANHVSTKHPLVEAESYLFCSKGSGTSFADAIAFNFYRPELGESFVNTFVNDADGVVHAYGQSLNAEITDVLSRFVARKMRLGFSGARVDCVRNIPSQIRQDMYRVIMEHSDPINAHIME